MAQRLPFSGILLLEPGDSFSTEGGAFQGTDRLLIDRLLKVGAVTHRHDAHAAIEAPTDDPVLTPVSGGGSIPADTTVAILYTLVDADGGETVASPMVAVTTDPPIEPPEDAPTFTVDATTGSMLPGTYTYALAFTDAAGGETTVGPTFDVEIPAGSPANQVVFTDIAALVTATPGAAGWRMYKASSTGRLHFLTDGDALIDTFTDNGQVCGDCSTFPKDENLTNATGRVTVNVPNTSQNTQAGVVAFNIYLGVDGDFTSPSFVEQRAIADLGTDITYDTIAVDLGTPPDSPTTVPGAAKINPDTDLLNWHWKTPVAAYADLGEGVQGDVRLVLQTGIIYGVLAATADDASDWTIIGQGGGGGGGGVDLHLGDDLPWKDAGEVARGGLVVREGGGPITDDFTTDDFAANYTREQDFFNGAMGVVPGNPGYLADPTDFNTSLAVRKNVSFRDGSITVKVRQLPGNPQSYWTLISTIVTDPGFGPACNGLVGQWNAGTGKISIWRGDYNTLLSAQVDDGVVPPAAGGVETWYWLRMSRAGNDVTFAVWTTDPALGGAAAASVTVTLVEPDLTTYAAGGLAGCGWNNAQGNEAQGYSPPRITNLVIDAGLPLTRKVLAYVIDSGDTRRELVLFNSTEAPDFAGGLAANWSDHATLSPNFGYRFAGGEVSLRGAVKKNAAPASGDVIATLPVGLHPSDTTPFVCVGGDDATARAAAFVDVQANGDVVWRGGPTGANAWVSLDGIRFRP